jgi:hypothetical protein
MAQNLSYNGNPTSAINQFKANRAFGQAVDGINNELDLAKKIVPDEAKEKIECVKAVLASMKSDADSAIVIMKRVIDLVSENPIGKVMMKFNEVGFEALFRMLSVDAKVQSIRQVFDVFENFALTSQKAFRNLPVFNVNIYQQGPFTFAIKKTLESNVQLNQDQSRALLDALTNIGRQIVAAYDFFLQNLIPGSDAIEGFMKDLKAEVSDRKPQDIFDQLEIGVEGQDIEGMEIVLSDANFPLKGAARDNRNGWARWTGLGPKSITSYQ